MLDVSPKESLKESPPPVRDNELHRSGTPFAVRAACFTLAIISLALGTSIFRQNSEIADMKAQAAQADSAADKAKADLATANATAADLQLQVTRLESAQVDLQTQLAKADAGQTDLQSQVEKARADLTAQQESSKAQVGGLQAQLGQATDESSSLRKQLAQAKSGADDLRVQLEKAQADVAKPQPIAVKAQALPVSARFEKSFFGAGLTMHVKNASPGPLSVKITVNGSNKAPSKIATIDGGETLDIADIPAGASVEMACNGYSTSTATAK